MPRQKSLTKLVRVNGIRKKISDFVGEVNAVLFTVQDLELIYGAPKIKLAEAQYLSDVRGENPLILLDDVFSELDPVRRELVWDLISDYEQSLITTSDMDNIPKDGISNMKKFKIFEGKIDPVD